MDGVGGSFRKEGWRDVSTAVIVSARREPALVEGRVIVKNVSLLWSVMSAVLLKIAQEKNHRG